MSVQKNKKLGRGLSALMGMPKVPVAVAPPASEPEEQPTKTVLPKKKSAPKKPAATKAVIKKKPLVNEELVGSGEKADSAVANKDTPQEPTADNTTADLQKTGGNTESASEISVENQVIWAKISDLEANRHQPRQKFASESLESLAASIRRDGVMQPILVREIQGEAGKYEIVAGERRWRASKIVGLETVPVLVKKLDDEQSAEWALVENLQREDLNPIEKAEAFQRLIREFNLTHSQVGEKVGVNRATITNLLRLLTLGEAVRSMVEDGLISMGHARAIAAVSDHMLQKSLALRVIKEGLSVRDCEEEAARLSRPMQPDKEGGKAKTAENSKANAAHLKELEQQISGQLRRKVRIKTGGKKGAGAIQIHFSSLDEFDSLLERLGVEVE